MRRSFSRRGVGFSGFSFVEVLLAAAVMAVISVGLVAGVAGILEHATRYQDRTQIVLLALSLQGDIDLRGVPEASEGEFASHPGFRWRVEVEPLREASAFERDEDAIKEVTFTIVSPSSASQTYRMFAR